MQVAYAACIFLMFRLLHVVLIGICSLVDFAAHAKTSRTLWVNLKTRPTGLNGSNLQPKCMLLCVLHEATLSQRQAYTHQHHTQQSKQKIQAT